VSTQVWILFFRWMDWLESKWESEIHAEIARLGIALLPPSPPWWWWWRVSRVFGHSRNVQINNNACNVPHVCRSTYTCLYKMCFVHTEPINNKNMCNSRTIVRTYMCLQNVSCVYKGVAVLLCVCVCVCMVCDVWCGRLAVGWLVGWLVWWVVVGGFRTGTPLFVCIQGRYTYIYIILYIYIHIYIYTNTHLTGEGVDGR
jgi:hypothetical protein